MAWPRRVQPTMRDPLLDMFPQFDQCIRGTNVGTEERPVYVISATLDIHGIHFELTSDDERQML